MTPSILKTVRKNASTVGAHLLGVPLLAVLVCCAAPTAPRPEQAQQNDSDSTQPPCSQPGGPWTVNFESNNPFTQTFDATGGATQGATLTASGANRSGYLRMIHILPSPSSITVYHLHPTVHQLTSGAITRIEYQEARSQFDPPFTDAAIGGGFFLLQNNIRYLVPMTGGQFTHLDWQTVTRVLTAADFPGANLTAQGGAVQFGFYRNNSANPNGSGITTTHGIDDWQVTICR